MQQLANLIYSIPKFQNSFNLFSESIAKPALHFVSGCTVTATAAIAGAFYITVFAGSAADFSVAVAFCTIHFTRFAKRSRTFSEKARTVATAA